MFKKTHDKVLLLCTRLGTSDADFLAKILLHFLAKKSASEVPSLVDFLAKILLHFLLW